MSTRTTAGSHANHGTSLAKKNRDSKHLTYQGRFRDFRFWLVLTFILAVLCPTIVAFVYLSLFKTVEYTTETRLSVRANVYESAAIPSGNLTSLISKAGLSNSFSENSDIYAIRSFILSANAIESVGGVSRMSEDFSHSSIDYISRLKSLATLEDALKYWQSKVSVYIDSTSGILILNVKNFTAEGSLQLTEDIVRTAEQQLNDMSRRGRQMALQDSEAELYSSARDMSDARAQLLEFQSRTGVIDPKETLSQIGMLIADLRLSQLELQGLLEVSERTGTVGQARRTERQAQVDILEKQIAELENQLTGQNSSASVASVLREYEKLKIEEEFTGQVYRMNRSAYEQARRRMEEQQRYVVQVVRPILAERPSDPHPVSDSTTMFGALFVLWGISMLLVAAIRDR